MSGGGKESPRQKMIGMMYLVLTALLALQVNNSVLEKFAFIDEALSASVEDVDEANTAVLGKIAATVEEASDQNKIKVEPFLKKAQRVREITKQTLEHLGTLRNEFAIKTGGGDADGYDDETGQLIGSKDYDIVSNYMINKGEGAKLEEKLNAYAAELEELSNDKFEKLARPASEIEISKDDPNQNNKDFAEFYFGHTPTAAGMATISHLESEVLRYEQRALEDIAQEIGATKPDFDIFVPLVRPMSNVVAAGAKFEADLYITASAKSIEPKFTYNTKELTAQVDENAIKYGKIEFTATPGNYDPKTLLADKSFEATVELNGEVYPVTHKYQVVKPVIQVRSAALSALYMNCGNDLTIQVPALGTSYNPTFSSGEATIIKGSKTGSVTIIPTGRSKVKLSVSNAGSNLGTETFSVKKPPLPKYTFKSRGKEIDMKNGIKASAFRSLDVAAVAEANFAAEVPKDAKYRIKEVEIILARGTRPIKRETVKKQKINLTSYVSQARAGDILVVEIKKVDRKTYQGKNERVPVKNEIYRILLK
jgi:gliding motility-associated protein GldM